MDFELILQDRIEIIKTSNKKYNLEQNAYISFSGGKDSTVLSYLIDLALPNNKIPRVFMDTGIEYALMVNFVKKMQCNDNRIIIIKPTIPIIKMLNRYGYPFKSKLHSNRLSTFQNSGIENISVKKYLGIIPSNNTIQCPKSLIYQFTNDFKLKTSDKCCYKLKKEPAKKWSKQNNKSIVLLGLRMDEGGVRKANKGCAVFDKDRNLVKFKPLNPLSDKFIEWFIQKYNIKLCELYYPPYNMSRTGCKGCPFDIELQKDLEMMEKLLPTEYRQCEIIWKPVYEEYRNKGYRLRSYENMNIYDFIDEIKE